MKSLKAPHCGALWAGCGRLRLRPFILCFYRTVFSTQKSGLTSSTFRPKPFPQISPKSYRYNAVPNRFSSRFSISRTNGPRSLSQTKVGTHSALLKGSHTVAHTAKQGAFPPPATMRLCAASEIALLYHSIPPCSYIHTFPGSLWIPTISRGRKFGKAAA